MNNNITYVAMDTHKKQHTIAALSTQSGEFVEMAVANTAREIGRMVKKIKKLSDGPIHFCYEGTLSPNPWSLAHYGHRHTPNSDQPAYYHKLYKLGKIRIS